MMITCLTGVELNCVATTQGAICPTAYFTNAI